MRPPGCPSVAFLRRTPHQQTLDPSLGRNRKEHKTANAANRTPSMKQLIESVECFAKSFVMRRTVSLLNSDDILALVPYAFESGSIQVLRLAASHLQY